MSELADTVTEAVEKSHEVPAGEPGGANLNGIAIALLGITALTRRRRLLYVGWGVAAFGLVLGISGFGFDVHPAFLARLLG